MLLARCPEARAVKELAIGLGIDETTAIIVEKSLMEVVGRGNVAVYDWASGTPVADAGKDHVSLPAGSKYDMKERKVLVRPDR